MTTLMTPLAFEHVSDPNRVKVVVDARGRALYFSRAPVPYVRAEATPPSPIHYRHIGIYGYRAGFLAAFRQLPPAPIERAEQLEQLRALWHGYTIQVTEATEVPEVGVDAPADVERVEAALARIEEDPS
jgi:3-deoxy-manno-octulosonate cytidylyltransferase (CMP-KDO synthetase)